MENATLEQEQERVDFVRTRIKHRLREITDQLEKAHNETIRIERAYGDATKVNITETDDRMETNAAVQQQKTLVARAVENETILQHEQERLKRLQDNPYFGRIDIEENGSRETLYIGVATFLDGDTFLVYDWRAPIASIYYNGTLGAVTYDTPVGPTTVELINKRQFTIVNGEITNMFDTDETVGDELLQNVLGEQTDAQLENIVATIQKEQNDIIRDTRSDVLLVQGVAGSGKTSAVLQRIAYLLYHNQTELDADEMILFSPNALFANYISAVLPSLGEKNMRQATMANYLSNRFSGLHVETLFERYERDLAGLPEMTKRIRRFKERAEVLDDIRAYLDRAETTPPFVDVLWNGEVFFSAKTITKIYEAQPEAATAANKFLDTKNTLIKRLKTRIALTLGADWVQERLGTLSDSAARRYLRGKRFASGDSEQRYIAKQIVKEAFAPIYDALYNDYFLDPYRAYHDFLRQASPATISETAWNEMIHAFNSDLEAHRLRIEDAAPILFIRETLSGNGRNSRIRYLFIDEMQDYSAAQLRYLTGVFPKAKLTLLGDRMQDVFSSDYQEATPLANLRQLFHGKHLRQITLNRAYRSTAPITNLAKALLPENAQIIAFNRDGEKPELLVLPSDNYLPELTRAIQARLQHFRSVAVITKDAATADLLFATLKVDVPVHLLTPTDHKLQEGCVILPIYLAKGLEFDSVIAFDVSAETFAQTSDSDLLYTLFSRALHELLIVALDEPSPLLKAVDRQLYTLRDDTPTKTADKK